MVKFPTYPTARREPAEAHRQVVDPAGWTPEEMRDLDRWTYPLTATDVGELMDGAASARRAGVPLTAVGPETFPLHHLASALRDVRLELKDGLGVARITGFPVADLDRVEAMTAYLALGAYIGTLEPQNHFGHLVGHVKNFADSRTDAVGRGYNTNNSSSFHVDSTDYAGLLCVSEPQNGGESRLASSVTVYNRILAERPELIDVLMMDFYKSRYGEERVGETAYYKSPVFAFVDGYFSSTGFSKTFLKAESLPGVPPYTEAQKAALPVFERIAEASSIEVPFRRGDIILVNNYVTLHSRHGFEDAPEQGRCRHLWRLWLNDQDPRPIHPHRQERRNRGLYLSDVERQVPLDLEQPVI